MLPAAATDNQTTTSPSQLPTTMDYPIPAGMHAIPLTQLDLRPDDAIDDALLHPKPVTSDKNFWFFWHSGFASMPPHHQRTIRAWHRRFSPQGWTIRVLDRIPSSPLNVSQYLDTTDPSLFPQAFISDTLSGPYAAQHTSDLVRWPLLLRHGGVYADVGMMQIGDMNALWHATIGNPDSPVEVLSYDGDNARHRTLTNYLMASRPGNPLFARCHSLFLALWARGSDGGRTSTEGMSTDPLLRDVPLMDAGGLAFSEGGRAYGPAEIAVLLSDYIVQGQVMTQVMALVDEEDGWDGPAYVARHVYAMEFMVGAQLVNELTGWDGTRAWELLSLSLPRDGEAESEEQGRAREIVQQCLGRSFGFKLATGLIVRVMGDTLGSLWRKHAGSDCVPGTYAHWLRYGMVYWTQDRLPGRVEVGVAKPLKTGPLLREA